MYRESEVAKQRKLLPILERIGTESVKLKSDIVGNLFTVHDENREN
jgi:hypothetical protein